MWVRTLMLSEENAKPHLEAVQGCRTINAVVKRLSQFFVFPTQVACELRRERKITLAMGEQRMFLEILTEKPPEETSESPSESANPLAQ